LREETGVILGDCWDRASSWYAGGEAMPRKRQPGQHTYSVYVDTIKEDGTLSMAHVYFGNSKFAAQMKLVQAITDNPQAYRVDLRMDTRLVVRVKIERP
jgi:hypothetical protein